MICLSEPHGHLVSLGDGFSPNLNGDSFREGLFSFSFAFNTLPSWMSTECSTTKSVTRAPSQKSSTVTTALLLLGCAVLTQRRVCLRLGGFYTGLWVNCEGQLSTTQPKAPAAKRKSATNRWRLYWVKLCILLFMAVGRQSLASEAIMSPSKRNCKMLD